MSMTQVGYMLVQVYNVISHSDNVLVVSSYILHLYFREVGHGKDRWLYPPSSCI
jgi:hypothetical protein